MTHNHFNITELLVQDEDYQLSILVGQSGGSYGR